MRRQQGSLTKKSGAWLGHFNRWSINAATGAKTRQQRAFVIGPVKSITRTQAKAALRARIEQESGLKDSRVTLRGFIDQRWIPMREGTWRPATKSINLLLLGHINKRFGDATLEGIDSVAMQVWLNGLAQTRSGSMVKHIRILLRSIFAEAVEQDYLRKSPARLLRLPTLKPVAKPYLAQAEITRLLQKAEGMHRLLLRTELVTGLRPSELLALRWSALDAGNRLFHIRESVYKGQLRGFTKTTDQDSRRELQLVYLPDVLVRDLISYRRTCRWKSDTDFIFAGRNGEAQWTQNYQNRVLTPLGKKAGISKLNFQVLRRTVATHAQNLGSAKDIASVLRHTRPDTAALHYTQTQDESVRRTVERLSELIQST